MDHEHTLTVYADYVCPFCYLGYASLESYLDSADDPPAVEWHSFDLRAQKRGPDGEIDHSVDDGKDDEYFEQATQNVRRLAEKYDVEMTVEIAREIDSRNAQQVGVHLQRTSDPDTFAAFHDAVFDALWLDGRDIGDPDELVNIAEGVGVAAEAVQDALADEELDADLTDRFETARRAGITGVPSFVYGQHAARGAVPPDQLRRLVGE
jgi:predicted DsbA family dithiol-disulfide isomerase